ncbi:MAG: cysteine synthase A [Helicobacteraceae bacterium]
MKTVLDLIGKTPMVELPVRGNRLFAKCEFLNPSGSIKDRAALFMVEDATARGLIGKDTVIIEPTSGNMGVALAMICAVKKIPLILTMPESMSLERRALLSAYGARLELSPAAGGMSGAVELARELLAQNKNAITLGQFDNAQNAAAHEHTTALEILEDLGSLDYFVAGVGTGGTVSGTARGLKKRLPHVKAIALEPFNSAVLSGEKPGAHKIQGIGAGFIPSVMDLDAIDEIIKVREEDAIKEAKILAREHGLLVGISSGANVFAAKELAARVSGKTIVTVLCDTGERYLSTGIFDA